MKAQVDQEQKLPPIHMAKVYLHQAQATKWRHWKFWLLEATAKYRLMQLEQIRLRNRSAAMQINELNINKHGQWSLF